MESAAGKNVETEYRRVMYVFWRKEKLELKVDNICDNFLSCCKTFFQIFLSPLQHQIRVQLDRMCLIQMLSTRIHFLPHQRIQNRYEWKRKWRHFIFFSLLLPPQWTAAVNAITVKLTNKWILNFVIPLQGTIIWCVLVGTQILLSTKCYSSATLISKRKWFFFFFKHIIVCT